MQLCIIADDLTGALDAAAPFAGRGMRVEVALSPGAAASVAASGADVMTVSTCSRDGSADAARAAMAQVVAALPPAVRVMKKIDSRLKGHVAAELSVLDPAHMLVAPAIPEFGRVTRDGCVTGHGVETPLSVAAVLGDLAARAAVPDVATPADMRQALALAGSGDLLVGARGLAEALAIMLTGRAEATPVKPRAARSLLVVGSRDPITLEQVAMVRAADLVHWLPAPVGEIAAQGEGDADPVRAAGAAHLLVQATPGAVPRNGAEVAGALARGLHPALTSGRQAMLLSGGATAEAVLAAMGISTMRLAGECLPGLPVADAGGASIIAKSGGFGDAATLKTLLMMFQEKD